MKQRTRNWLGKRNSVQGSPNVIVCISPYIHVVGHSSGSWVLAAGVSEETQPRATTVVFVVKTIAQMTSLCRGSRFSNWTHSLRFTRFYTFFLSVSSQQLWNWCSWVANSSDFDRSSKVLCQSHCDYPDRIKIPASGWPLRPCILVRQRYRQAVLTGTWWLHRFYYLWPIRCFPAFILNIGSLTFENVSEKSGYPSPGLAMSRIGCNVGTVHELTVGLFELGLPVLTSKYRTFRCW